MLRSSTMMRAHGLNPTAMSASCCLPKASQFGWMMNRSTRRQQWFQPGLYKHTANSYHQQRHMSTMMSRAIAAVPASAVSSAGLSSAAFQRRFNTTKDDTAKKATEETTEDKKTTEEEDANKEKTSEEEDQDGSKKKKKKAKEEEPKGPGGIKGFIERIKSDLRDYPDIYNGVNLIHFLIFTTFCLCSTGSNVEEEWWLSTWGIDATFAPWAWPLHSILTNNFLAMTWAMLILNDLCVTALPVLGVRGLIMYMGTVASMSGAVMWGGNYLMANTSEKQFGPWDVCAALFVMKALHQGVMPWTVLNSFNSWVKYALWVGAACLVWYDPQPIACGTAIGFVLCKAHPRFRGIPVAPGK